MTPPDPRFPSAEAPEQPDHDLRTPPRSPFRWYHKLSAVLFATFCLEIGFFLLIFPWTDYSSNFAAFRPEWRVYWDNAYVRGAISGLGVVNLYIAFLEIFHLRRFAGS